MWTFNIINFTFKLFVCYDLSRIFYLLPEYLYKVSQLISVPFILVSPLLLSLDPFDHPSGQLSTFGGRLDGWIGRWRGRR